jgi:hypothetical protein
MAHYAFLDENNIVVNVIVGTDENELINGLDVETFYGNELNMRCVRTSYNTVGNTHREGGIPFRKNFAQIGFKYDEIGFFNPEKPFPSWTLDSDTYLYNPPKPKPLKDAEYVNWNKEEKKWEVVEIPWILDYEWKESEQEWEMVAFRIKNGVKEFFMPEDPATVLVDGEETIILD